MTMNEGSPLCNNTDMQPSFSAEGQTGSKAQQAQAQASDAARELKGAASQATTAVSDATRRTAQQAKHAAGDVLQQAKGQARQLQRDVTDQGAQMFDEQKSRAADSLGGIGTALHRAAQTLHEEHDDHLAGYADSLADGIDSCANYLRERDFRSLLHDAGDVARRRPELVLGGAFVAGLALVRFLKASSPSNGDRYDRSSGQHGLQYATSDQFMHDSPSAGRYSAGAHPGMNEMPSDTGPDVAITTPASSLGTTPARDFGDETRTTPPSSGLSL